jgi:predicted O-methyltransferase YrrM
VLGQEFPGVRLTGVDIEPKQLEFARGHLGRSGVEATLVQADAWPCRSRTNPSTTSG